MATSAKTDDIPKLGEFQEDLRKFHLAQVIADRYEKDPQKLGAHYDINFTPAPPRDASGDDPAEDSIMIILSGKPEYRAPNFGNLLIPKDPKGKANVFIA